MDERDSMCLIGLNASYIGCIFFSFFWTYRHEVRRETGYFWFGRFSLHSHISLPSLPLLIQVRNPLSSAIAALSFVAAGTKEPTQTEEEKKTMQGDLKIIDASLQFISELLRNMLDMVR